VPKPKLKSTVGKPNQDGTIREAEENEDDADHLFSNFGGNNAGKQNGAKTDKSHAGKPGTSSEAQEFLAMLD
jgi:hypothetical protein